MSVFDSVRYYIALVLLVGSPGSALFWLPIHPLAAFWRRVGYAWAYVAGFSVFVAAGVAAWIWRGPLLAVEFGGQPLLAALGVVVIAIHMVMRRAWQRQLSIRTLFGAPELAPSRFPGALLTRGAYARVRHPRYAEILVALLGYALIANYLALYLVWLFMAGAIALVIPLEERELAARFGAPYLEYRRRVPALIPRFR